MFTLQNTTYNRVSLFLFVFTLFLAGATTAYAQKIDIDKKAVTTSLISLPRKDVDTSFHTFSYTFKGDITLPAWGMDMAQVKDTYFKLEGYQSVEKSGDLHLEANLPAIRFLDSNVESRVVKSKDKSGRETSTYYYKHVLSYDYGFSWKLVDKNGKELTNRLFSSPLTTIKKFNGEEYTEYKKAYESYNNNRAQVNRNIATKEINESLSNMYSVLNEYFGYKCTNVRFNIWLLDTEKHPEYEAMKKHFESVKAAYAAIDCHGLTPADVEALQPAIAYYKSIPEKYKADEKADKKLRYAAYFNLANIYLHLDDVAKVKEYSNLLIENDYDKGDGKDFIKDAENLIELFESKQVPSRRFPRN